MFSSNGTEVRLPGLFKMGSSNHPVTEHLVNSIKKAVIGQDFL